MMLAWGGYVFSVGTAAYASLQRSVKYAWRSKERVGKLPMQEFTGRGEETISLRGVIYPDYRGGIAQVDLMRIQAGLGKPLPLVGGDGRVFGLWCARSIDEDQTWFDGRGRAQRIEFRLELVRYGLSLGEYAQRFLAARLGL